MRCFLILLLNLSCAATLLSAGRGLILNDSAAFQGYTLYTPLRSTDTVLINMEGQVVHKWISKHWPANSAYLLPNGNLIRCAKFNDNQVFGNRGPSGGRVEVFDWEGNQLWDYLYSNDGHHQHHDIEPLPNGNVLILAWEKISKEEAVAAGRNPTNVAENGIFPDTLVEVKQTGFTSGDVVWKWSAWDHLVQDFDASKSNYGKVADHPELIDVNLNDHARTDWMHTNAIDYNPELDQIVLSPRSFNEILIIDHSTTTEEARGHRGGKAGKGGDILYRWGNPANYRAGGLGAQTLFQQHDSRWVRPGHPGEGNLTIFNNLSGQSAEKFSTVYEIRPPLRPDGSYTLTAGSAYTPAKPSWFYKAAIPTDFYSSFISGAERLPNGNTLICSGAEGIFFEVTATGKTVWEYHNPYDLPPLGPEGPHSVFRVVRYAKDYAGFKGRKLTP